MGFGRVYGVVGERVLGFVGDWGKGTKKGGCGDVGLEDWEIEVENK